MSHMAEPSLPIACSLTAEQLWDRREVWQRLHDEALLDEKAIDDGVQLVYAAHEAVEQTLYDLARLESECCAFAEWQVARLDDTVVLRVTSRGDGITAVQSLFGVAAA